MATFSLTIKCYWSKENGFEKFIEDDIETEEVAEVEEQDESADDQEMASDDE